MALYDPNNFFNGLGVEAPSMADLGSIASSQGYRVEGNRAVRQVGRGPTGYQEYTPLSAFATGQSGPSLLDQGMGLLQREVSAKQAAADRQFERNNKQISGFESFLNQAPARFAGAANESAGYLDSLIKDVSGFAVEQGADVKAAIAGLISSSQAGAKAARGGIGAIVKGAITGLNSAADRAEAAARDAVSRYDTGIQEDVIAATVSGLRRSVETDRKSIEAGLGPNGTLMSAAERQSALRQLRFDTGQQITQMAAQVRAQAQGVLAGLRTNVASTILQGGQLRGQAAQVGLQGEEMKLGVGDRETQARTTGLSALLQSQAGQQAMKQLVSQLTQFKAQMKNATSLASLDFEMSGRSALANMVSSNPETVIGVLTGFLAMAGIATAPGGRNQAALRGI